MAPSSVTPCVVCLVLQRTVTFWCRSFFFKRSDLQRKLFARAKAFHLTLSLLKAIWLYQNTWTGQWNLKVHSNATVCVRTEESSFSCKPNLKVWPLDEYFLMVLFVLLLKRVLIFFLFLFWTKQNGCERVKRKDVLLTTNCVLVVETLFYSTVCSWTVVEAHVPVLTALGSCVLTNPEIPNLQNRVSWLSWVFLQIFLSSQCMDVCFNFRWQSTPSKADTLRTSSDCPP